MKYTKEFEEKLKQNKLYNDINIKLTAGKEEFKKKLAKCDESLFWSFAGCFGVCFEDLSSYDLSIFNAQEFSRVPFSTYTKFPKQSKMPKNFNPQQILSSGLNALTQDIKNVHQSGINGQGVTIAILDSNNDFIHDEIIMDNFTKVKELNEKNISTWHGLVVTSMICGKHNGIAPKSNILYYPHTTDESGKTEQEYVNLLYQDMFENLKDVLNKVKSGKRIDIVTMSGCFDALRTDEQKRNNSPCQIELEYLKIKAELEKYSCYVITASEFWANFGYAYKKDNLQDKNDYDNYVPYRIGKINVICGGKTLPLSGTQSDYMYDGTLGSASWAIPQVSAIFALAKQINKNITFEEFINLAHKTARKNKVGVMFFDIENLCKEVLRDKEVNLCGK